jgi:NitT/TauT family transport system substrate-binding protein
VRYIDKRKDGPRAIADARVSVEANINMHFSGPLFLRLDAGAPITILAGVHPGCCELFATERVRTLSDLKGKTVGIRGVEGPEHVLLASMLAYVGLDSRKDVRWVTHSTDKSIALLAEGKIERSWGSPPIPRSCARGRSDTWSSTAAWTAPGHNTSAAWSRRTASSCRSIQSPPSAP